MLKYDMNFTIWQGATMKNIGKLLYSAICIAIIWYISAYFTRQGIQEWYANFDKPTITPPNNVFPVIWSILYIMMGAAFYLVLKNGSLAEQKRANSIFLGQLLLQAVWTFLFFAQGHIGIAFAVLLLLNITVLKMQKFFRSVNQAAGYLIIPYFWWLIYATLLNLAFVYSAGLIVHFD